MADDGDMTDTNHTRNQTSTRLDRSREDRIIGGVAGGLGNYMGANPWLFRFAFIVLAFFGGIGVLLYIAAWLLIPDQGEEQPILARWLGNLDMSDGGTIFGVLLVAAAGVIILGQIIDLSGTLVIALVLFVVGFLLYRGDLITKKPTSDDPPEGGTMPDDDTRDAAAAETAAPEAPAPVAPTTVTDPPMFTPPPPEPEVMWEPPPPKESSMLGRITVAIGLIVLASMALIDLAFDRVDIEPVHYIATAVVVLGAGLVVGGFVGRARWLILIGVVLLPALWFTSFWPQNFSFTAGETRYEPVTVADVDSPYELGAGQLTLDLSSLSTADLAQVGTISASLGMGEMIVILPPDTGVDISAQVGAGAVEGPFDEAAGVGVDVTRNVGTDPVVLELDLEVGLGVIKISDFGGTFDESFSGFVFEGSNS